MKNILTIDVEEWYHGNYKSLESGLTYKESRVESNTDYILEKLSQYNANATFFILGEVAEKYPSLVRKIHSLGHEIGSHGYLHNLVYRYTKEEFIEDVKKSKLILEDILGTSIIGYRAPSWSVNEDIPWFYDSLENLGFLYSSSVFPRKTYLYGMDNTPRFSYKPNLNLSILEIPCTTAKVFFQKIPFSGGFYFRVLPYFLIKILHNLVNNEKEPVLFYLHPREIDPYQPKLPLSSTFESFIHHYGINSCNKKFIKLLNTCSLTSIKDYFLDF